MAIRSNIYRPVHRGVNHDKRNLSLPVISKLEYDYLKELTFNNPPLVKGVLIPIANGKIIPSYDQFKGQRKLEFFSPSPYHQVNWQNTIYNRMPKHVINYRRTFLGTELVPKPEYRNLLKNVDTLQSLKNLTANDIEQIKNNNENFEEMDNFNSIGQSLSGGVSFGNQSDNVKNLPLILAGITIVFLLTVTGTFKNIFGGRKRR